MEICWAINIIVDIGVLNPHIWIVDYGFRSSNVQNSQKPISNQNIQVVTKTRQNSKTGTGANRKLVFHKFNVDSVQFALKSLKTFTLS